MESKEYNINGVRLVQRPLKIAQLRAMLKLIANLEVDLSDITDIGTDKIIDILLDKKFKDAVEIIFGKDAKKVKWDDVSAEQAVEIVSDFLSLNGGLIDRLKRLLDTFVLTKEVKD